VMGLDIGSPETAGRPRADHDRGNQRSSSTAKTAGQAAQRVRIGKAHGRFSLLCYPK
jgi:hypothetical protein